MKRQFQSTETLRIRLKPFLNKNDWSYIMGTDGCKIYIRCPDGDLLETEVGGVPAPTWDDGVKMWSLNLEVSYYTDHQDLSTNEWKVYALSWVGGLQNPDGVPQWLDYYWGDYVDDITTGKTAAVSVDTKLTSDRAGYLDKLNVTGNVAAQGDVTAVGADVTAISTKIGTPVSDLHTEIGEVKTDTAAIKLKTDTLPTIPASQDDVTTVGGEVSAIKAVTDALPTFPTTPADQDTLLAVKERTDRLPDSPANEATLVTVGGNVSTTKSIVTELQTITKGHWKIVGTQLLFYDGIGAVICRFNLYDDVGSPTNSRIFERTPV